VNGNRAHADRRKEDDSKYNGNNVVDRKRKEINRDHEGVGGAGCPTTSQKRKSDDVGASNGSADASQCSTSYSGMKRPRWTDAAQDWETNGNGSSVDAAAWADAEKIAEMLSAEERVHDIYVRVIGCKDVANRTQVCRDLLACMRTYNRTSRD